MVGRNNVRNIFILIFLIALGINMFPCTIFSYVSDNGVFIGNNEDYYYSAKPKIWIKPSKNKKYGRICFGWYQNIIFPIAEGGINEKGLFIDGAMCPELRNTNSNKNNPPPDFIDKLLSGCANVNESIDWLKNYNFTPAFHLLIADKSGESVIIEWNNGNLITIESDENFQVITNFWLNDKEAGYFPCERFNMAESYLKENNIIQQESFLEILEKTSQKYQDAGTLYSNLYDLNKGDIVIYYKSDFKNAIKLNIFEEILKGEKEYDISYCVHIVRSK